MAVPYSSTKLRVPKGFQNLIEGFAREVLRNQPENIYEFGARYFQGLLTRREETGEDPAVTEAAMEDRFYNNKSFKTKTVDVSSEVHQEAAVKIQTKYRQYAAKQEVDDKRQEQAASKIQAGFRGFKDRTKIAEMKKEQHGVPRSLSQDAIDVSDVIKSKSKQSTLDDQQAAAKIQAGFRGYKDRQKIAEIKSSKKNSAESSSATPLATTPASRETDPDKKINEAASVIQAGFRGMQTRKKIKDDTKVTPRASGDEVVDERNEETEAEETAPDADEEAAQADEDAPPPEPESESAPPPPDGEETAATPTPAAETTEPEPEQPSEPPAE